MVENTYLISLEFISLQEEKEAMWRELVTLDVHKD